MADIVDDDLGTVREPDCVGFGMRGRRGAAHAAAVQVSHPMSATVDAGVA